MYIIIVKTLYNVNTEMPAALYSQTLIYRFF